MSDPDLDPNELVTNDAVAGETVLPGESNAGPLGGEPAEAQPTYAENDLENEPIDLDDGAGESAGAVPEGDGDLESDDLSAIDFTADDDIPETNELDIDEIPEGPL
jgi:hypothetical protein